MVLIHNAYKDFSELPPLNLDERHNPFAKYYEVPVVPPADAILEAIAPNAPMDPSKAMPITEIARLFDPADTAAKNGWCILPDGTGYATVTIDMPDMTPKEYSLFVIFGHMNTLNYKVWLPKMHLQQGDFTIKDLGWGPLIMHPHWTVSENKGRSVGSWYVSPDAITRAAMKAAGIDIEHPREMDPEFIAFSGGSMITVDVMDGELIHFVKLYYVRHVGEGLQIRVCSWMGMTLEEDGTLRRVVGDNEHLFADRLCGIATGCAFEWTRANAIGREVCRDLRRQIANASVGGFL